MSYSKRRKRIVHCHHCKTEIITTASNTKYCPNKSECQKAKQAKYQAVSRQRYQRKPGSLRQKIKRACQCCGNDTQGNRFLCSRCREIKLSSITEINGFLPEVC